MCKHVIQDIVDIPLGILGLKEKPPHIPKAPERNDAAIKAAGARARKDEVKRRRGRRSTILTGSSGITGDAASGQRKTLLGE